MSATQSQATEGSPDSQVASEIPHSTTPAVSRPCTPVSSTLTRNEDIPHTPENKYITVTGEVTLDLDAYAQLTPEKNAPAPQGLQDRRRSVST